MLAKLRSQLRARGICQKRNLVLPAFILSTTHFLRLPISWPPLWWLWFRSSPSFAMIAVAEVLKKLDLKNLNIEKACTYVSACLLFLLFNHIAL